MKALQWAALMQSTVPPGKLGNINLHTLQSSYLLCGRWTYGVQALEQEPL